MGPVGVYNRIEDIIVLSYLTTGNGFYLYEKGIIQIANNEDLSESE